MAAVMMVGGGVQQVAAVQAAQALGFKVIVTDKNPAAPCFSYADQSVVIDGRDIEGLAAFALLNKQRLEIEGVFTLTELVTSVAATALAADLPGVDLKGAVACQDKAVCKDVWLREGIPTPRGSMVSSLEQARRVLNELGGQAFLKPVIGFGGRGAQYIDGSKALELFYDTRVDDQRPGNVLIEEYIDGEMHDVNGLIDENGVFHPLGIANRHFLTGWPVETEVQIPSTLTPRLEADLYQLLEEGVKALGIKFGPVKGDAVLSNSGFQLLEVAPRLHGPRFALYASPMTGFDPLPPVLLSITGHSVPEHMFTMRRDRYCLYRALLPPPGRILMIKGLVEASQVPGVETVMLFAQEGDVITAYRDSTQVPGYVFATGQSLGECDTALRTAIEAIVFSMEPIQ